MWKGRVRKAKPRGSVTQLYNSNNIGVDQLSTVTSSSHYHAHVQYLLKTLGITCSAVIGLRDPSWVLSFTADLIKCISR